MQTLTGNIVSGDAVFYGKLSFGEGKVTAVEKVSEVKEGADWVLPGFIDTHLHGLGPHTVETPEGVRGMAEFAPSCGTTALAPTFACHPDEFYMEMLPAVRDAARQEPSGAKIAGSHMEGPFLSHRFKGGMTEKYLALPDLEKMQKYIDLAEGTLKIVTIAPELPGALEVIDLLRKNDITVSAGHSDCPPEHFPDAVSRGVSRLCHIFDAWDVPGSRGGVRQPAVTDLALIDDRVMTEIIMDGLHVPPELITLARRAAGADHIVAISDAMQGAGLPSGRFKQSSEEWYYIKAGDVARREADDAIVGSSLSMNYAFYNMICRFGFSVTEACCCLSKNPARSLGWGEITGVLSPGFEADITLLGSDNLTVKGCFVSGVKKYQS